MKNSKKIGIVLLLAMLINIVIPAFTYAMQNENEEKNLSVTETLAEDNELNSKEDVGLEIEEDSKIINESEENLQVMEDKIDGKEREHKSILRTPTNIGNGGLGFVDQGAVAIYALDELGQWTSAVTDENGQLLSPEAPTLEIGQGLRFKVNWGITDIQGKGLVNGDYFEFNLPSNYFKFSSTSPKELTAYNPSTGTEETIGTFEIVAATATESAKVKIVLNETAANKDYLSGGYVNVYGFAQEIKNAEDDWALGEWIFPNLEIEPSNPNQEQKDHGNISKDGWQVANTNLVTWSMNVNFQEYKDVYNNERTLTKKSKVVLIDELPEGIKFTAGTNIDLAIPIYATTSDNGRMSNVLVNMGWNNYTVLQSTIFNRIDQVPGETWTDFKTRVESSQSLSYGVFTDTTDNNRDKFIMNFGDHPGDLKSPMSLEQINTIIDEDTKLTAYQKTTTKDAYQRIYNETSTLAIGFIVQIQGLEVLESAGSPVTFNNIAELKWLEGQDNGNSSVHYQEIDAGAETGDPQSVTIKKKADGTGLSLQGAKFKLQKQSDLGVWEEFNPIDGGEQERTTNASGEVIFKKLPHGTYRVVEVSPPIGYTTDVTFENGKDTFTIDGTEKGTIFIVAINKLEVTKVEGTKTWDDQEGKRPESIVVELHKTVGGKTQLVDTVEVTPNEDGDWKYKFEDLPVYEAKEVIEYSVKEQVPEGYTSEVKGVDIINSYTPEETELEVVKSWNDENDKDKIRPNGIKVELYSREKGSKEEGKLVDTQTLDKDDNWKHKWTKLDRYKDKVELEYYVTEKDVPKGYKVSYDVNKDTRTVIITNSHTPSTPTTPDKPRLPKSGIVATWGFGAVGMGLVALGVHQFRKKKQD